MVKKDLSSLDISTIWDAKYKTGSYPWMGQSIPSVVLNDFISLFNKDDLILDYGCGDGFFSKVFFDAGLDVIGADISTEALSLAKEKSSKIKFYQANHPSFFKEKNYLFDGLFVWGVLHHVDKGEWGDYIKTFSDLLKSEGYLFIGGHTKENSQFEKGYRVSKTTGLKSHAIDDLPILSSEEGFLLKKTGVFDFQEKTNNYSTIKLKYFLLQKQKQ